MELGSNHPYLHVLGANHAYLQLRAELNCEGRSSTSLSQRLTNDTLAPYDSCLIMVHSYGGIEGSVWGLIQNHSVNIPCGRKQDVW
jgi:hypothetical protein